MKPTLELLGSLVADLIPMDQAVLGPDTDLLSAGLLDSLQVIQLASEVERVFSLRLDAYDLTPENFTSLSRLAALIEAKRALSEPLSRSGPS